MPANPLATPEGAIDVVGEMVAEHRRMMGLGRVTMKPGVHPGRFAAVAGLNSHAHALAEAALPLWNSTTAQVACVPLARAAFECGLLAQWLSRDPEAMNAMVVEYERQQRALAEEVSLVPFLSHLVEPMLEGLTGATSPKSATARSWKLICKQFVGGDVLYAHYRLLCRYTHASIPALEQWLDTTEVGTGLPFSLRAIREPEKAFIVFFGWALLFTASAYGDLVRVDRGYNNRLNRWAFRMSIDRRLRLV